MARQKRRAKKAARQQARAKRKETRFQNAPRQRKGRAEAAESARLDKVNDAEVLNSKMKAQAEAAEISRLAQVEAAEEEAQNTGVANLSAIQEIKAKKYLQRRGVRPLKAADMAAAQVVEERYNEIQERLQPEIEQIENDLSIPDEERADWMPDEDDIHEEILDAEFFDAQFNGYDDDGADYLDADTLGTLYNVGKAALDKYRAKQYAKNPNKKILGQTKKEWEAAQAAKMQGDTVGAAAMAAAESDIKKQKLREYTPQIVGGVIVLIIVGIALYVSGKKSS